MPHHLDYVELTLYASIGLGLFRVLSQFVIKLIAIFARDKFSARAFEVLKHSWMDHAINRFHDKDEISAPLMQERGISTTSGKYSAKEPLDPHDETLEG